VINELRKEWEVTCFFFNPNIFPEREYVLRRNEMREYAAKVGVEYIEKELPHAEWRKAVKGFEKEPEGGQRCRICFHFRLREAARIAAEEGFDAFTTTLTISPHKNADMVNSAGIEAEREFGVTFLERNFKKRDGFKISCQLSKEAGLRRQDYCGCEFSMLETRAGKAAKRAVYNVKKKN